MTRGRPFLTDYHFSRRAASVPAEDISYGDDPHVYHKVYTLADHVKQDTDEMSAASKRHDRDFMHDINAKLANVNTIPYPSSRESSVARQTPSIPDIRYNSYPRSVRSGSVPPILPSRPTVPKWYTSTAPGIRSYIPPYTPGSSTFVSSYTTPSMTAANEDRVVGVAHTALYGDVLIGIPYNKRFMFNVQHDPDALSYHPHYMTSRVSPAPSFVGSAEHYSYPHTGQGHTVYVPHKPIDGVSTHRGSYLEPGHHYDEDLYSEPVLTPPRYHHHTHNPGPVSYSAVPHRHLRKPALHFDVDYDEDLDDIDIKAHPDTLVKLHGRSPYTKSQLINNYIPTNGPRNPQVEQKYAAILARMPDIRRSASNPPPSSRPSRGDDRIVVAPQPLPKPPMSEARRKVRDTLCKSKGNPNYFP